MQVDEAHDRMGLSSPGVTGPLVASGTRLIIGESNLVSLMPVLAVRRLVESGEGGIRAYDSKSICQNPRMVKRE